MTQPTQHEDFRLPSLNERRLMATLTSFNFLGKEEVVSQLTSCSVRIIDINGSLELRVSSSSPTATVRYPVLEIEARVEPFENGRGFTLRALAARRPRSIT